MWEGRGSDIMVEAWAGKEGMIYGGKERETSAGVREGCDVERGIDG